MAGTVGGVVGFVLGHVFGLPPLISMIVMLVGAAGPMWWLEYHRMAIRESPPAATKSSSSAGRLGGGLVAVLMLAISMQAQLWIGGAQVASVAVVATVILPGCLAWLIWLRYYPALANDDSVEELREATLNLLRLRKLDARQQQVFLGWAVKAFFLPLMLAWLYDWLVAPAEQGRGIEGWWLIFFMSMSALYALDTLFGTIGYISTTKLIDSQIRSTDSTWLGWISALACYPPLSAVILRQWLDYRDGLDWQLWLVDSVLAPLWAAAIVGLTLIYTWATLAFGPRFSNLTNRGIITSGPYRWTKHPAYISKNLSWWLIAVPFVSDQGALAAMTNCLALLGVNGIYWVRAKTEERHLMQDPVYREYAAWIARFGWRARCMRVLGFSAK